MDLNWLTPMAHSAQPMRYATSSFVAPTNFVFQQWDDVAPNWEIIPKRDTAQTNYAPFKGCGRKQNPVLILKAIGSLSAPRDWTKKCGSEKGTDSGQFFICPDCAISHGYHW